MQKSIATRIIYWLLFTLVMAFMLGEMFTEFWQAWTISIFMLPSVVVSEYGLEQIKTVSGRFPRFVRIFFWAVLALYLNYLAILFGYWYLLELDNDNFQLIFVNPFFIWIVLGFFIGLDKFLFKSSEVEDTRKTITILSDRKKTVLEIETIAYVESRGEFTVVWLSDGQQFKNRIRISAWVSHLPHFLRIHRSFLVNPSMSVMKGAEVTVNGQWDLPISRSYRSEVRNHFAGEAE